MDYTTEGRFRAAIHSKGIEDGSLISLVIGAASRAIDRYCTGTIEGRNYFLLETMAGELLEGQADMAAKTIICYPHKPVITAVSAFDYREDITQAWNSVASTRIRYRGPNVTAYPESVKLNDYPSKVDVMLSYTGGLGALTADLPEDLVEAATTLAVRFYREDEGGLSDAIGVAELSTMIYTKAWPVRVRETLNYYKRLQGWHHVA